MEVNSILPASLTYGQQIGVPSSPIPASAALTITAFSNLFSDAMSPEPVPVRPLKRRSVSPEGSPRQATSYRQRHSNEGEFIHVADQSSSPAPPSSPSARKFERFASTGGLFRKPSKPLLNCNSGNPAVNKRSRRPTISVLGSSELQSAYPILESQRKDDEDETALPPPRRAFSAMIAASGIPSLLARSPMTVFTALAVNAYKSVLEAQHKLCLAFLTSDESCDESDKNLTSSCLSLFLNHPPSL